MSTLKRNKNVWGWGVIFPLFILIVLLSGCDNTVVAPRFDEESNTFIIQKSIGDLEQEISLSDLTPAPGDTLTIESIVTNSGDVQEIESRICGLNITGNLEWKYAGPDCDGYSKRGPLAGGEKVTSWQSIVVTSQPGDYRLEIQHLLEPEEVMTVWITVED